MPKRIFILLFLIISFTRGYSQIESFPNDPSEQPDGVTIGLDDVREYNPKNENQIITKSIFVGEGLYVRLHRLIGQDYLDIYTDLSPYRDQLDSLTQLITVELIDLIDSCCHWNGCGELGYAYFFILKKGDKKFYAYIDLNYFTPEMCGNSDIITVVRIFNDILKKTNKN